jgi:Leucine-rich repeat (LRR) protein
MEEDFPWENRELSHYGSNIKTLDEIELPENLEKLRILHCESLTSMAELAHLTQLEELNLSSNSIARIEGLHHMSNLKLLNLS